VTDYDTAGSSLVSKTHYYYDQFPLMDRTGMTGHDPIYTTSFTNRSNLTTTSRWLASENRWISTKAYYDILGNVVQTTDARNYSSTIDYSAAFQYAYPTQAVNAKGHAASTNYSFYTGQVLSSTDVNGQTSTNTYDSLNRLLRTDYPDGSYVRYTYDLTPNNFSTTVYKLIAPGQESSATSYQDGIAREYRTRKSDPAGDIFVDTQFSVCDCQGKKAKVSNPYRTGDPIYWTETQYDSLGRVTQIIPPDGLISTNRLRYIYDLGTPTTTIVDAAGKQKRYEYDAMGRIFRISEPDSSGQLTLATTYNYLPSSGQPGLVITQGAQTRTLLYDTLGRLVSETHPESGTTTYAYDDSGNLMQKTDARGWATNYSYDEINRPTGKTYQNDGGVTPSVALSYDSATNGIGKLASWSSGNNSGSTNYDFMGRTNLETLNIAGDSQTLQRSFAVGGELVTTTYPNAFTTTNGYDATGRLETITSSFGGDLVTNIDRNAAGSWTQVNYGNGVINARTFNLNLRLESLRISAGTDYFYKTYGYNEWDANNGRIASITDNLNAAKSVTYTYDEMNRLATATTNGPDWGLSWSYDRYGNRLNQTITKGTAPSDLPSINSANNRISSWTYDAVGNVTNDGRNIYAYDAEDRVISINGGATTYTYDAGGIRLTKTTGTTTIRYYFGAAEKTNSSWTKILIGTPAGAIEWDNGTMHFKSNNHLGTPAIITNGLGALVGQNELYPYGEILSETGNSTKFKLSGKERDIESGNEYFGARYYSNVSGRFLTTDPVFRTNDPQSLNRYIYAGNDPINFVDPDGRDITLFDLIEAQYNTFSFLSGMNWNYMLEMNYYLYMQSIGDLGLVISQIMNAWNAPYLPVSSGAPSTSAKHTPINWELMNDAKAIAKKGLLKENCRRLFGGSTSQQLINRLDDIINGKNGNKIIFQSMKKNVAITEFNPKYWFGQKTSVTITINTITAPKYKYWNDGDAKENADTLLHEFGHAMAFYGAVGMKFQHKDNNDQDQTMNSVLIQENCLK
jgi:RHS repeat-associated protein